MKNWILATRPHTLFASLAPVLLGLAVAYYEIGSINKVLAALTIACAMLLQIASNLANDYLDAIKGVDNDSRLGPIRVTSSGLIAPQKMKFALILTLALAFLMGAYLMYVGGAIIMIIGLLSMYFAYGYTGGPYPLSYNGLGEVSAFIFYGVIAVFGTSYIQTHNITIFSLLLGVGPGFISACILAINNLRDIKSDSESHKRTLAVRFGESFQRKLCLWMIILSVLSTLPLVLIYDLYYALLVIPLVLLFNKIWLGFLYSPISAQLNNSLKRTSQYNLLYCLTLAFAIVLKVKLVY